MKTLTNEERNRWLNLVRDMDIPELRRDPTEANLRWFLRNAAIRNTSHDNFYSCMNLVRLFLND
jgi:hypothetical protein